MKNYLRRNRIAGQFAARYTDMLESPATGPERWQRIACWLSSSSSLPTTPGMTTASYRSRMSSSSSTVLTVIRSRLRSVGRDSRRHIVQRMSRRDLAGEFANQFLRAPVPNERVHACRRKEQRTAAKKRRPAVAN
jgi:hypothetical protein